MARFNFINKVAKLEHMFKNTEKSVFFEKNLKNFAKKY